MRRYISILVALLFSIVIRANFSQISQITTTEGLSSQNVRIMEKDKYGRLWVGSSIGLDIFNNGTLTNLQTIQVDSTSILTGQIKTIACGERTLIGGKSTIIDYDYDTKKAEIIQYEGENITTEHIIMNDSCAYFYDNTKNILFKYMMATRDLQVITQFPEEKNYRFIKLLEVKGSSRILLLAENERGIFRIHLDNGAIFNINAIGGNINAKAAYIDSKSNIWIQSEDGLNVYDIHSGYSRIHHFTPQNSLLPDFPINCMEEIPDNEIMICTRGGGVFIANTIENRVRNTNITKDACFANVQCMLVNDKRLEMIYGTASNGILQTLYSFIYTKNETIVDENTNTLTAIVTMCAYQDNQENMVWFGTAGYGIAKYYEDKNDVEYVKSTSKLRVVSLCEYDDEHLYFVEESQGLMVLNKKSGEIVPKKTINREIFSTIGNNYSDVRLHNAGNNSFLLLNVAGKHYFIKDDGTEELLDLGISDNIFETNIIKFDDNTIIVNNNGIYSVLHSDASVEKIHLFNNNITSSAADSLGNIWMVAPDMVYKYNSEEKTLTEVLAADRTGFYNSLQIDNLDRVWLSSRENRIICFEPTSRNYHIYSKNDGVNTGEFQYYYTFKSKAGFIYFPHAFGLLVIDTEVIEHNHNHYDINCTSIVIDNENIDVPEISVSDKADILSISHKHNSINLAFSINSFNPTNPIPLRYTLKRGNKTIYSNITSKTTLNLERLEHGNYSLYTQQLCREGWTEPKLTLQFVITKPFMNTVPAYIMMVVLLIAFAIAIAKISMNIKQISTDRILRTQENMHKDEKINLMTNIAHELRTPLSLMYNPVKDLLDERAVKNLDYERIERIFNQINKMNILVDSILDTSKNEMNIADIDIEQIDINNWLGNLLQDFKIDCLGKGLHLVYVPDESISSVGIDRKFVEIAINNLVTNAIKYSESGTITVSTSSTDSLLIIAVKDEGRGFSCNPENLFQRYYREQENDNISGYGLGLSYARLLIRMLNGDIKASRNSGKGSTFTISLPLKQKELSEKNIAESNSTDTTESIENTKEINSNNQNKQNQQFIDETDFDTKNMSLLIVDDQEDILEFISKEYSILFKEIYTAHDGKEALEVTKSKMPNIIVSDIMMPKMTGFELCKKIKTDVELSHIPVLLLTSRTDPKNQDMGYKMGADAFIPKPFDAKALYKIIRSQLRNRYEIRRQYASEFFSEISEDQTFSIADEEFVHKLNSFIKENISDQNLNIDKITNHMGVSRTTLFNKMSNLIGSSANKYIRRIRMDIAKDLLLKTDMTIGEIALKTGFTESQYFSTVFKQETGLTPSQFKEQNFKKRRRS
ncbi:MAG: response regulator [Bacteroidaceae bacterium]|nr:response regulator [Bacteroidaceae bacterium]